MKREVCQQCEYLTGVLCGRDGRPIRKIRGCSRSPSGKVFLMAKSGREAYRREILGKQRKEAGK